MLNQAEPIPAPGEIAHHVAHARQVKLQGVLAVTRHIVEGHLAPGRQLGGNGPDRGIDFDRAGFDPPEMRQGDDHPDGAVTAHAKVADVVEENDAELAVRLVRLDQQGADHDSGAPWFTHDGGAEIVMLRLEHLNALAQRAAAEVGPAFQDEAGGFTTRVSVEDLDGWIG